MPPEILALIAKPHLLIAVLFVGIMMGMTVEQLHRKMKRAEWKRKNAFRRQASDRHGGVGPFQAAKEPVPDAADQLRTVMNATFQPRPLLNRSESRLFGKLNEIVAEVAPEWRVMAQVSLGEILASKDDGAYRCVNSKRVDLLLIDHQWRPVHAIEYQGRAHHQGKAVARDAVKKEALRRAGIGYLEIVPGDTPAELKRVIAKLVQSHRLPAQ